MHTNDDCRVESNAGDGVRGWLSCEGYFSALWTCEDCSEVVEDHKINDNFEEIYMNF